MTEQIMADVASPARAYPRGRAKSILRQVVIWLFAIIVVVPVALVLLFRFVPPPTTPLIIGHDADRGAR